MSVYLDNAATSWPKPQEVYEAVEECMRNIGASPGRSGHQQAMQANRIVFLARRELAALLGVSGEEQIIFTHNATDGLNMAIKGLVEPGDHIITSALEHNAVARPLMGLVDRQKVELTIIPFDPVLGIDPEAVRGQIRKNTRCIVMTHASNVNGMILPVKEIGSIAEERNIRFIVDGAQTAGIVPVDVEEMKMDVFAFTGHKGLLGPQGTGGIFIRKGLYLKPWREGGTGSRSSSDRQPEFLPDAYEAGTPNTPGIAGLLAAVRFIRKQGVLSIGEHERILRQSMWEKLQDIPGLTLYKPEDPQRSVGVLSFTVAGKDPALIGTKLDRDAGIACRTGLHCAPWAHRSMGTYPEGTIRFGFGFFNTIDEVRYAAEAVRKAATI